MVGGLAVLSRLGSAAHQATSDIDTVNRRAASRANSMSCSLQRPPLSMEPARLSPRRPAMFAWMCSKSARSSSRISLRFRPTGSTCSVMTGPCVRRRRCRRQRRHERTHGSRCRARTAHRDKIAGAATPDPRQGSDRPARHRPARSRRRDRTGCSRATGSHRCPAATGRNLHVERWFGTAAGRSSRLIRTTPGGSNTTPDTVTLVGELLLALLTS